MPECQLLQIVFEFRSVSLIRPHNSHYPMLDLSIQQIESHHGVSYSLSGKRTPLSKCQVHASITSPSCLKQIFQFFVNIVVPFIASFKKSFLAIGAVSKTGVINGAISQCFAIQMISLEGSSDTLSQTLHVKGGSDSTGYKPELRLLRKSTRVGLYHRGFGEKTIPHNIITELSGENHNGLK